MDVAFNCYKTPFLTSYRQIFYINIDMEYMIVFPFKPVDISGSIGQ